jgi:predicted MFS family arabinose efflux permease
MAHVLTVHDQRRRASALVRSLVIGLIAFLTLVDLFAAQAILPALTAAYGVTPAAMGLAVNASTLGMAAAALLVALASHRIDRRLGILVSLALLAIPTALLASAPSLASFAALRVAQGVFMVSAFTLTLAYLGERCSAADAGAAFAAYIAGNVASNLVGRLLAAAVADHFGLASTFYFFAALNLCGALLVHRALTPAMRMTATDEGPGAPRAVWRAHLANPALRASFAIGFCILFAFIGAFTYVNFVLVRPPFELGMMRLGLVYLVFLPSLVTTLFAGRAAARLGTRRAIWGFLALAGLGLPPLLGGQLPAFLGGLALVAVGTFGAQAAVTGFVGGAATAGRAAASGLYLACYFFGGLVGTAVLGAAFDAQGWAACVGGIALALAAVALLTPSLRLPSTP